MGGLTARDAVEHGGRGRRAGRVVLALALVATSLLGPWALRATADGVAADVAATDETNDGDPAVPEPGEEGDAPAADDVLLAPAEPESAQAVDPDGEPLPDIPPVVPSADGGEEPDDDGGYYRPSPGEVVGDQEPSTDDEGDLGFDGVPPHSTAADYRLDLDISPGRVRLPGGDVVATVHVTSSGPSGWLVDRLDGGAGVPPVAVAPPSGQVTQTDCMVGNDLHGGSAMTCTIGFHVTSTLPAGQDTGEIGVLVDVGIVQADGERFTLQAARPLRVERPIPVLAVELSSDAAHVPETGGLVTTAVSVRNVGEDIATLGPLVETTDGSTSPGLQLWDLPGSTCGPIVLTPGASWSCAYPRWLTGEGNVVANRIVAAEASIADGTTRSYRAQTASSYDDMLPGATLTLDVGNALAARDGRAPAVEVRLASTTPESIMVDELTVQLDGAVVADSASACRLPTLVAPATGLVCTVSVPLTAGQPGQVTVGAAYRDNEGNGGSLSDGLVLQVASPPGESPGAGGSGDAGGDVGPAPAARPLSTTILPVTGAPLRDRARQGIVLLGAGVALLLLAAGMRTGARPATD